MISGSIKYTNSTGSNRSYSVIDNDNAAVIVHGSGGGTLYRTLDDVRQQVAQEVAVRVVTKAEMVDGEMPAHCRVLNVNHGKASESVSP
jgi:hypothetical protein